MATRRRPRKPDPLNPKPAPAWGATKAQARQFQRERDLSNRIFELEQHLVLERNRALELAATITDLRSQIALTSTVAHVPIPLILFCPSCHERHIDVALADKPHRSHACQHCGAVWAPAAVPTVGVQFLPGYKDEVAP